MRKLIFIPSCHGCYHKKLVEKSRMIIFLDSGDPQETKEALKFLTSLNGQTTNPSLIAKNPDAQGKKFTTEEIYSFYKKVIREISALIPQGSVSVEVYADKKISVEQMVNQA